MTFRGTTMFPTRFSHVVVIAAIILAGSAACGGSGGSGGNAITDPGGGGSKNGGNNGGSNGGTSHSLAITVTNNSYSPGTTAVAKGSTVQWTWNSCQGDGYGGNVCTAHTVTFDDGVTSEVQESGSFSRTFNTAGTYKYHCTVHGAAMSGEVTIE